MRTELSGEDQSFEVTVFLFVFLRECRIARIGTTVSFLKTSVTSYFLTFPSLFSLNFVSEFTAVGKSP